MLKIMKNINEKINEVKSYFINSLLAGFYTMELNKDVIVITIDDEHKFNFWIKDEWSQKKCEYISGTIDLSAVNEYVYNIYLDYLKTNDKLTRIKELKQELNNLQNDI